MLSFAAAEGNDSDSLMIDGARGRRVPSISAFAPEENAVVGGLGVCDFSSVLRIN